ncbi:MAG TPA: hypothetical protein PLJ21_03405 [Pseudobdellovibrionaceae bacterium]|nr:hypothetical protein [Pseudobdellovibrionaceae bacterium]
MNTPSINHEKLFDEICSKLNELSRPSFDEYDEYDELQAKEILPMNTEYEIVETIETVENQKIETVNTQQNQTGHVQKIQQNLRKVQGEIDGMQEELKEKIRNMETVSYETSSVNEQIKVLSEQIQMERANNTKLSTDLAKSLELTLQMQLELQGTKARANQIQNEEKKYSQSLFEKNKVLQNELELTQALRDEVQLELNKAKNTIEERERYFKEERVRLQEEIRALMDEGSNIEALINTLKEDLLKKDDEIAALNSDMDKMVGSFTDLEGSARQQGEALKNLMNVAETKIVEIKLALDKKTIEAQDYYNHLQQSLTQMSILKQENAALKDYVEKHQQL